MSRGDMKHNNMARRPAHDGSITCVALSPSKETLASGGEDGLLKIWNLRASKLFTVLRNHKGPVSYLLSKHL